MIRKYLWIAAVVLVLDQLTKVAAVDYFAQQMEVRLAPFLSLVMVHNTGAAFGFLGSASGWRMVMSLTLSTSTTRRGTGPPSMWRILPLPLVRFCCCSMPWVFAKPALLDPAFSITHSEWFPAP